MRLRIALLSLLFAAPVAALDLGATAPKADVKMKAVDGREVSIAEIAGKQGTLVIFTCNHCPWAKAWEQRIAKLGNDYAKRGVGVIAVNANDPKANADDDYDSMVTRAKTLGLQFPYVVDGGSTVARAFGAERTPEAFVFDAQGKLVYHGTIDDNAEHADQVKQAYLGNALEAVATGKPVETKETKALGCTIKFYES
jgi:peroxiredoxin